MRNKLAKEANERYDQKHRPQTPHSTVFNSIKPSIVSSLKGHLESSKRNQLNEVYKYIEENKLPSYLLYNIIDFQQATGNKYVSLSPLELLTHIGMRYKMNVSAVTSGSTPKASKTLYNVLPRPFRPLYFDFIKIVATILPESKLRTFDDHLLHWYNNEIKETTYYLLHCRNNQELDNIINRLYTQINNSLWVPRQIKAKDNQLDIYFRNKGYLKHELHKFIAHSYINWKSDHGTNETSIRNLSPNDIMDEIREGLENNLKLSKMCVQSGWTIFESSPQRGSYIYNELVAVLRGLGGNITQVSSRIIKITSYKKNQMKRYIISFDLCNQATC